MNTGATLNGRALAQTAVTLIANTINWPAVVVITSPIASSSNPADSALGVALNQNINVTFSKTMDSSTITASTFTLMQVQCQSRGLCPAPAQLPLCTGK